MSKPTRRTGWPGPLAALVVLLTCPLEVVQADFDEPPAAGRPAEFSGLVGTFEIAASASPTDLRALEPLTLTIKITETSDKAPRGPVTRRSALRALPPSLAHDFYVEALPDLPRPNPHTWEFAYRLKPKQEGAAKIPSLKLSYFDPQYSRYQVAYSRPIVLQVKPRAQVEPPVTARGNLAPDRFYTITTGPAVLRREGQALAPPFLNWAVLLLVPPTACVAWYAVWRRLHPDAARRARLQRSQAARRALAQLRSLHADKDGAGSAAVLADYLRCRLDLAVAEPTPAETLIHLRRAHVSPRVAGSVGDFFRAWDAFRFGPEASTDRSRLAADAKTIILALEAEPCLSRPS